MTEITDWTATQTAQALADRIVSVTEVTHAHLARLDGARPDLNAITEAFPEQALDQARALDAAGPDPSKPLWGLPISVKLNVDMEGHASTNGVPGLVDNIAPADSTIVANLKAAEPVILGRTNAPEFSLRWFTSNPIFGTTLNPLDPTLTPGGSSGGASAAIASGIGVMSHGNDLGGSLRNPAYCCGLTTLRPSLGKVPAWNPTASERPMTTFMMSVQGMIARSVADVRLGMGPLSARSGMDPFWTNAPNSGRVRHAPPRVGIAVDPFGDGVAPEVERAVESARTALMSAGCVVVDQKLPMIHDAAQTWGEVMIAEVEHMMAETIRTYGSPDVVRTIEAYRDYFGLVDMAGFMAAQARRQTILRAWNVMFEEVDAVIMPVASDLPYRLDQDFREPDTIPDILSGHRGLYAINFLGLPSAVLPTLDTKPVPLGVQVVSAWRDDDVCLDIAEIIERELALNIRPV